MNMPYQSHIQTSGNGSAMTETETEADRRRSETRTICNRPISLMPLAGEDERFASAHLTDCSQHGLGLMLPSEIKAGEQMLVRLNVNKMMLLVYTVRYCIPTQIGQFRAGARFTGYAANSFQGDLGTVVTALAGNA